MRAIVILLLLLIARGLHPSGQAQAQPCTCLQDVDTLFAKLERNYVGYRLEIAGKREADYAALKGRIHQLAQDATGPACLDALTAATRFFEDGHLFITQAPTYEPADLERLRRATEKISLSEAEVRASIASHAGRLDPIEGIWYTKAYEVAVVRDTIHTTRDFVAVVLASKVAGWQPGHVQAEFSIVEPGVYQAVLKMDDHSPRYLEARLYKNLLLHMPPYTWGRRYPLQEPERALLHPQDPRAPTYLSLSEKAGVLSIPSHVPLYRSVLDSLLKTHHNALMALETLIVDIRGDEGGSAGTTKALMPYLYTDRQRPGISTEGQPVVLASPDNLRYFQTWKEWYEEEPAWLTSLLDRMEKQDGAVIPYIEASASEDAARPQPPDTVYASPTQVAVLIDGGVVSAGEAFVLKAMRNQRVTLFGRPTGGVIDYQNVRLVRLACRSAGYLLGYPTLASSDALPEGGLNKTGIAPDVYLDGSIRYLFDFILGYYYANAK